MGELIKGRKVVVSECLARRAVDAIVGEGYLALPALNWVMRANVTKV